MSPWWTCSKCGHENKPHAFRTDNTACEQCGKKVDEKLDLDRKNS